MLSDRRQRVLAALIEEYVNYALPVGSRTLTERYQLGVSAATIRNELSALEDDGYISQPHTSAGRIPTDYGYRAFVDDLIENGLSDEPGFQAVAEQLKSSADELDVLKEQTTAALARLTDCLSIVMESRQIEVRVKQLTLISLSDFHVLMVLVTEDGQVLNRQLELGVAISSADLAYIQTILNNALSGCSYGDVQNGVAAAFSGAYKDPVVRAFFDEAVRCLRQQEQRNGHVSAHRVGLTGLMAQPEFSRTQTLVPLMHVLENETVLLHLLNNTCDDQDIPSVFIGKENKAEGLEGVSVVASRYGRGDGAGIVAVIGPTRMNYSKVIQAVQAASQALHDE